MNSSNSSKTILVVEDNPRDLELTLTALKTTSYRVATEIAVARDGTEALDFMFRRGEVRSASAGGPASDPVGFENAEGGWARSSPKDQGRCQHENDPGGHVNILA